MEWNDKIVLVTGAAGTIGAAIIQNLLANEKPPEKIIGIDNNEGQIFEKLNEYNRVNNVSFVLCDIRDFEDLNKLFKNVDIVIHCAALKHVIINELAPNQTISTNIIGTQNIIKAALDNQAEKVVFTSSDKAVNPTNVMGTSKLMGERLMSAADAHHMRTRFSSTRFGNVLGSNGSVLEIFKRQVMNKQQITITDPAMTRFIMSIEQAADLVTKSVDTSIGGEVLITKMPVVKIVDLAHAVIVCVQEKYGISYDYDDFEYIGTKPGEKLFEELMTTEELHRSVDLQQYFSVLPAYKHKDRDHCYSASGQHRPSKEYNSELEDKLPVEQICDLLNKFNLV